MLLGSRWFSDTTQPPPGGDSQSPPSGSIQPVTPASSSSSVDTKASKDIKEQISKRAFAAPVSADALRALGRPTPSMRLSRNSSDRTFNDSGTSLPYKLNGPSANQVYKFVGNIIDSAWLTSGTIEVNQAKEWHLTMLGNQSPWTNLFDQYRIDMIEVWLMPRTTTQISVSANTGMLCSVIDYDDTTTVNVAGLLQYGNVIVSHGIDGHYRRFRPHVAVASWSGAFTGYKNEPSDWIDLASDGVQHFGLKVSISATDASYVYDLMSRVHISFRNQR